MNTGIGKGGDPSSSDTRITSTVAPNPPARTSIFSSATTVVSRPLQVSTTITTSPSLQTSTTTPDSSASNSKSTSSCPSSTGKIVGAAVGAALGAALVAILCIFLWLKYRAKRFKRSRVSSFVGSKHVGEKTTVTEKAYDTLCRSFLPQEADDRKISTSIKSVFDHIELHVENFYQNGHGLVSEETALALSQVQCTHLGESPVIALNHISDTTIIIKHCLVEMVIRAITLDPNDPGAGILLPMVYRNFPDISGQAQGDTAYRKARSQAASHWRVLTAFLTTSSNDSIESKNSLERTVMQMTTYFGAIFAPWSRQKFSVEQREHNLASILQNAAETGQLLFAQPSTFDFTWPRHGDIKEEKDLCITPRVKKIQDEQGLPVKDGGLVLVKAKFLAV